MPLLRLITIALLWIGTIGAMLALGVPNIITAGVGAFGVLDVWRRWVKFEEMRQVKAFLDQIDKAEAEGNLVQIHLDSMEELEEFMKTVQRDPKQAFDEAKKISDKQKQEKSND